MRAERRQMMDRRKSVVSKSECPLDHESVDKLLGTLDSIDKRLQKIERFMLIGHVVVWTIGILAGVFWWFYENVEILRLTLAGWVNKDD